MCAVFSFTGQTHCDDAFRLLEMHQTVLDSYVADPVFSDSGDISSWCCPYLAVPVAVSVDEGCGLMAHPSGSCTKLYSLMYCRCFPSTHCNKSYSSIWRGESLDPFSEIAFRINFFFIWYLSYEELNMGRVMMKGSPFSSCNTHTQGMYPIIHGSW